MTLLEFLAAAARAGIVAADALEGVSHRRLLFVVVMLAMRAVNVTSGTVIMAMLVIVLTVRAVDVRLSHLAIP